MLTAWINKYETALEIINQVDFIFIGIDFLLYFF